MEPCRRLNSLIILNIKGISEIIFKKKYILIVNTR